MNKKNFDKHFNGLLMGFANHPVMQKLLKEGAVDENFSKHMAVLENSAEKVLKWINEKCKQGTDIDSIYKECSNLLGVCQNAISDVAEDIDAIKENAPNLVDEEFRDFQTKVNGLKENFEDSKFIDEFKDALKEYVKDPQIDEDDPIIEYFPDKEFSKYFLAANQNEEIQVFPNEPNKNDIVQTNNNACYFLAGLHSLAENHPDAVKNLIRDNGDGTVTVKFYPFAGSGKHTGTGKKKEMLVTIDKTLPRVDSHSANWVRLLEKALAASKLVTAGGYEPDKSELHKETTIDYLDGGQPNLTMSLLDPSFSGSPYDRNYVSDQMKSLKDVGEAFEAFGQKLINAKKNGSVIALCDDMHVVDVTDIVTDNRGNYTLTYYDQMRQRSESLSLRRDVFTGGLFKSIMIYDFASQKDSHEATNIIFGDILKEVRAHKKDKNYVVPEETKQWQKDLAAGKGEPPLVPLSQEEVDRYEKFNQIRNLDPEQRKNLVPNGLPQLFVPDYKKGIKEEVKEEPKQEIKKEAKPEVKPVEQPKPVVAQPKHEISKNKEPKKLNFTNQFIAKTVEKITVKDNQRIKSEGVDYGGVPIEIQMTNDIMYMNNWYDRNKEKLSPEADSYFQAHYESARYFEKLSLSRKSNKKTPTDMNVGFYDPDEKGVSEFEKGEYCIPNLGKQRNQTSDSGCWSCAYENLLRSRGVDIPQEMIRSFRSNDTMSHLDLEGYKTDSREKDGRGINGKRDVALQYITDTSENIMTRADLMLKVLPNTAMRTKEFTFPTEELLKSSGVTEDTIDEKLLGNKMLETVRDAIGLSRSPVAVYFGGHYRTISAVNIEKRTIRWVDSMDQDPNAEREIKIDDLITHCRTARPDASIAFTWMEDLVPDEKGNCSINGFEDYKYQDKKLYNNNRDLNSSDDYVKNGILATKSIDDNNLMILETVCLPEDLITLSAYQQQIPPEIEVSGKPHVYAEDPYPLPTNKRILVQKPSAAPDKIDDLKKEDLERNPKIYDDPQEIMFRENVNLVLNSWDEKEKYFPDIVDSDDLKNRIKIEKSNRTEVLNSFIGAINKMNNELTQKGEEPLKFPDWKKNDRLFRRLGIMQNNHYKLQEKLIDNEHIYSSYAFAINSVLPDKDHILSVEQLEAKAEPVSQEPDAIKELNRYFEGSVYEKIISNNPDMYQIAFGLQYEPENMNEFLEAAKNISNDLLVDDETRRNALRRRYKDWFKNSDNLMEVQRLCTDEELTVLPNLDIERFLDKMSEMQLNNLTRYNDAINKKEEPQIAPVKEEIKIEAPQMQTQIKQQINQDLDNLLTIFDNPMIKKVMSDQSINTYDLPMHLEKLRKCAKDITDLFDAHALDKEYAKTVLEQIDGRIDAFNDELEYVNLDLEYIADEDRNGVHVVGQGKPFGEGPNKFPGLKDLNDSLYTSMFHIEECKTKVKNHIRKEAGLEEIVKEEVKEEIKKEEPQIAPVKEEIKVEEPQIDLKQQEPQIDPKMQAQINQQVNAFVNSKGMLDDMLKQQLGDAYNPEEMKAVHNQMEAEFMKDKIYETLAKEGIIKNVLGYGLGTRLATYNHLINIRKDENEFKNHLLDIGYAMEELKPEAMQGLFEQGKINKAQLDYYNNNRNEFNGDAAVEYVQGEFYKKANSLAEQLNEPVPFSPEPKQEVKPVVEQAKQENNLPRDFQLFMLETGRIRERILKTYVEVPEGGDYWAPVKKALAPLNQRLSKISNEDNLQKIDVDSLYDLYRNAIDTLNVAVKKAPQTEGIKKCELLVKEAFSKEELKASADAYIADFKNPIDVDKLVKPKNPLKYSDDPLQKKMQQAALKLAFWNKFRVLYSHDDSEEVINKKYDQCARAIENGTDENMLILNSIDKSKVGKICDMVLSKGSISSLIDFKVYMPDENSLGKVQPIIQQAFETFFNPKAQEGPNKFYNAPLKDSDPIVKDANRKIQLMNITVPEGLDDNDVALLTAAELMSDKIIGPTFKESLRYSGSSIPDNTDLVHGGRDAFANSLLGGDERTNMQFMRYGVVEARLSAARILEEYKSGNKQAMADALLGSLVENAKYQKMFMTVDNTVGAFYTKCISDTIKLLDSDKFKGLVEIPQEVRDIDKLNKAHIRMAEEAAELKVQLNDYCIEKILNGNTQNPKDDPEFVNLYSKWYARTSHLGMEKTTNQRKRTFNVVMKKGVETDKNRELTGFEKKLAENADEYIRLSEEFFLDSDAKKKLFEKDYTSWRDVLSTGIKITSNAEVVPVTLDLEDEEFSGALRFAIESLDDNNYPGIKGKLLSRPPLDGAKLPRNASKAEVELRLKQYDDYLDYFDSLNLQDVPSPITKEKGRKHYLRDDLAFPINNFKKKVEGIKNTLADARKFEKAIGVFEKESSELYDLHTKEQIGLFTDEIVRLAARVAKTDNDKYKNSMSYKGLQFTISDCASKKAIIKTENELKGIVKFLDQSANDYLEDHANEKMGFFKTCGKARRERIKTCARIKTMKELLDKGIAYDSPEGKKRMLACKLVCAEKLDKGFPGFKELCQPDAIKNAIDEKLNDPVFKIVANRALEKETDYDKLVKMPGGDCLKTFNKAKAAIEKANAQEKEQEKEQEVSPQL